MFFASKSSKIYTHLRTSKYTFTQRLTDLQLDDGLETIPYWMAQPVIPYIEVSPPPPVSGSILRLDLFLISSSIFWGVLWLGVLIKLFLYKEILFYDAVSLLIVKKRATKPKMLKFPWKFPYTSTWYVEFISKVSFSKKKYVPCNVCRKLVSG